MGRTKAGKPLPCDNNVMDLKESKFQPNNYMALSMTLCSSTTSSLKDPLACLLSDTQSAESHLGHVKDPEDTIFQTVPRLPNIEYLRSLVTVPTQTASLVALPSFFRFLTKRARESGGRLILTSEHEQEHR